MLNNFSNFVLDTYSTINDERSGPCADYKPGEEDLQGIDFIRKFKLDQLEKKSVSGFSVISGSNLLQTAYRLESNADLVIPTR